MWTWGVFGKMALAGVMALVWLAAATPALRAEAPAPAPEIKEPEKPEALTGSVTADILSQYIFRGVAYSRDSVVMQPSFTLGYKGIAMNVWSNFDTCELNRFGLKKRNSRRAVINEVDFTVSYSREVYPGLTLTGGFIYYYLSNNTSRYDSQEIYGGFSYKFPWFEVGFAAFREVGHFPGTFLQWYVSRSIDLPWHGMSLDLYAGWSAELSNDKAAFPIPDDSTGGYKNQFYQSLHAGNLMATLNVPIGKYVKVSPKIAYWYAMGGDSTAVIGNRGESNPGLSWDKKHNHVYGGVNLSVNF